MKKLLLFVYAVVLIWADNLHGQGVYRASEGLSINRNYIAKALSSTQFKWEHYQSNYFCFHYLAKKWSKKRLDSLFIDMDKVYLKITGTLQDTVKRKRIDIFLAGNKEDVKSIAGGAFSAAALLPERGIVFSNHPATTSPSNLPHEIMHICSMDIWGLPYDFLLSEGLATYACGKASFNYDFHSIIKYLKLKNKLPKLTELLNYFYRYNEITGYYSGASFVKYVLDKHGIEWFKTLWIYGVEEGAEKLGTTVEKLEADWHSAFMNTKSISDTNWKRLLSM
jgi:hypothetical protein